MVVWSYIGGQGIMVAGAMSQVTEEAERKETRYSSKDSSIE